MATRQTTQRLKILEHLKCVHTHPTAEEVHKAVIKDLPTISLATVYRNLNLLSEQGAIIKLEINNEFHFDAGPCEHQHFVCTECGGIWDINQKNIYDYAMKNVKSVEFCPVCVHIIFKGKCKRCKGDKK
ncbi:MAG: transcriptional repressor [Nanoarchaeota archaeon]|nr:transcriptional repressor [Nanoarchaeota archaeon]